MANGTKGQGQAPPSGLPLRGGQTACPPHPLGNFYGLILGIASCATRGDAELEGDWESLDDRWEVHRVLISPSFIGMTNWYHYETYPCISMLLLERGFMGFPLPC
jgi:hypothetical protein